MKKLLRMFIPLLALGLALGLLAGSRAQTPPPESTPVFLPLAQVPAHAALQAPVLKWTEGGCYSSWCETGWYSSPAVANLDGDPQLEILAAAYSLFALQGEDGARLWQADNSGRAWPGVAVADLTGDGTLEIIVARSGNQLTVYNTAGGELWTRHPLDDGEIRTLAVADLEDDGLVEMIVGRASGGSTRQLSVVEPDGSTRPGWPARRNGEVGYGWGMYNQNAAVGDLDNDGSKEIIGPTDTHYITALDKDGNQLTTNPMYDDLHSDGPQTWAQVGVHVEHEIDLRGWATCGTNHRPNFADAAPAIADLDGDGTPEIIVVGNVYNCATDPYASLYHMPFIFNADRSRWAAGAFDWTVLPTPDGSAGPLMENYNVIETVQPNPAIADLDGDGLMEILYSSYDGRLHAYWLDKTEHGNWPYQVHNPAEGLLRFGSEPVVADLNRDGTAEVILSTWVQKGSGQSGHVIVLDYLGNELFKVAIPPAKNGDWNGAMATPTLANVDADADLELILMTAHSGVVVYDLPGTAAARVLWGSGRGSLLRSGTQP
jgi:hypothetical protein